MGPLTYNTPANEFTTYYPNKDLIFKGKISTQLPTNVVIIRTVAICLFSALALLTMPVWGWPVALAGAGYAAWTIYSHLIKQDPLVEAFYKIVGGKDKYEQLPEFKLKIDKSKSLYDSALNEMNYDHLQSSLYKSKTNDGRRILIVKALTRHPEYLYTTLAKVATVFIFIEKYAYTDLSHSTFFEHAKVNLLKAINLYDYEWESPMAINNVKNYNRLIKGSISSELANEFAAQL